MTAIGRDRPLSDGRPKVLGAVRYCADLERPGLLHARLVTSPHAHALLRGVDTEAASAVPGVAVVLTAEDLPEIPPNNRSMLMLARDRVLFVGHPYALVLAESEQAAQDGADAVLGDFEPQPAVLSICQALAADSQPVWPEGLPGASAEAAAHGAAAGEDDGSAAAASPNVATRVAFDRGNLQAGFAAAHTVVERELHTSAVHQSYLEPHVTMAEWDPLDETATVWTSTQATFYVRDSVAQLLGVDNTRVRVVGTPVGGGFGGKFLLYEPMLAIAARLTGRPVRLAMTRLEEMLAANPAPATRIRIKAGADREGILTALDAELVMDNGCFPASMAGLAGVLLGSSYTTPNQRITGIEVLTHRASVGAYRAPCAPQCAFALETVIDELAAKLGVDPLEMRRRNAAKPGDPMAMGNPWPTMGMREVLERLAEHPAWTGREQARAAGRGVGIALGGWPGGTEPAAASCMLDSDGTLQVRVGSADITGTNTSLEMIAAEAFGIDAEGVEVIAGDTQSSPFAGSTGGSKIIYTLGPAVIQAAQEARRQVFELAAHSLEAAPEDLEIREGSVQVKGVPGKAVPLAKIAQRTMRYGSKQAPVYGSGRHAQSHASPGFCAQLAEVEVDPDTGRARVHKLVVIQDVGKAINPAAVRGQMLGAAVQGIGWALLERMVWDEQGQLVTATWNDYAIPHVADAGDEIETVLVEVPSDSGPFGARGVGEPPVIATAAAIANAIADATGARLTELPMSPPRILEALAPSTSGRSAEELAAASD
ncbi:MAG TPA: xanthine dehydrogenase family protein molybdopterin-binding subunit [Thermoanaerobaculia bacterium]|nr:xanthine dehydrogenase family protein molybdopterin-binding subunit [Thermoanaerobaculia bacterium]